MKKSKIATLAVTAFITIALYIYSLYSAYWIFKRGNVGEIILYTALLALCDGAIMLLYTLTDKKRIHSTANKVIVPIASLRLMNIADGMEDYDYFTLAEAKFGKEWVNEKIAKVVTSSTEYTSDHALFEQVRREIGVALAEA